MRKIKVNYYQMMDVLAMHLESIKAIKPNEHVEITPFAHTNGMVTVYVFPNKDLK